MTNELVTGWCITEWVKRLVGSEIELGIEIPTIKSRASNTPMDKGNYVCCHNGSIVKDLRRICRSQYGHPGSSIGYRPERCLGHVYIVLEPVGPARLTFVDDIVLYELCDLVTECCSVSQMRSQTWRGVSKWSRGKYWYIGRWYSNTGSVSEGTGYISGHRKGFPTPPTKLWALWAKRGNTPAHKGMGPPYRGWPYEEEKERGEEKESAE